MTKQPIRSTAALPVQPPTTIYGREDQVGRLRSLLSGNQVVWLHGPAGVGRRTLAASIARSYVELPGGVLWFTVYHDDIFMLAERVLRAYGVSALTGGDATSQIDMSRALLQRNRPLIVLDGPIATRVVAQFVECCIELPMIIVARSPQIGPWQPIQLDPLSDRLSEQLYRDHAQVDESRRSAFLAPLLHYVQGLPLSLVVSAQQWIQVGASSTHLASLLPGTSPGPEHRALGVFTAAFLLLEPSCQGLFLLLGSLFTDRVGLELLKSISGVSRSQLQKLLKTLVERGLCYEASPGVYRIHDLARILARRRLHAAGQLKTTRARILEGILRFVQQNTSEPVPQMFEALELEMDHILGAARYAVSIEDAATLEILFKLMGRHGTQNVVHVRGYHALYDRMGRLLSGQPYHPEPYVYVDQALGDDVEQPVPSPQELPVANMSVGSLQQALQSAEARRDWHSVVRLLTALGDWYVNHQRYGEAREHFLKLLAYQEAFESSDQQLTLMIKLANVCLELDYPDEALHYIEQGLELRTADNQGELMVLRGDAYLALGSADRALESYLKAIDLLEAERDLIRTGLAMGKAATAYMDQNNFEEAIIILGQSAALFEEANRRDLQGQAMGNLGTAFGRLGRWREAGQRHMLALRLAREVKDVEEERFQLCNLAFVAEAEGHFEWAIHYNRQALYLSLLTGDQVATSQVTLDLGRLLLMDTDQLKQAVILLEASVNLYPQDEAVRILSRARKRLSRLEEASYPLQPAEEDLQKYAQVAYEEKL